MIRTTMYLHRDKDSNYEVGERLGLEPEALSNFAYALCEVCCGVEVDPGTGDCKIVTVDGREVAQ